MEILSGLVGLQGLNTFHQKRFEDLINRRGWLPILWERAVRCPCYSLNTGNADPKCIYCAGVGYIWREDLTVDIRGEQLEVLADGQFDYTLKAKLDACQGDSTRTLQGTPVVRNTTTGVTYTVTVLSGTIIRLSGGILPAATDIVVADYTYLRDSGANIKASITNVDYQRDFIPSGEWLQGDAIMSVSGQYKMGFRDRITIPEEVVRNSELKRRYEVDVLNRSMERLRYKTGIRTLLVRDTTQTFVEGVDFTYGPDMTIIWGSALRPKHRAFKIKYTGNATSATLTVTISSLTVTLVGQTDGSLGLSLNFTTYPTVKDIVELIKTKAKYVCDYDEQSLVSGIDNAERMGYSIPVSGSIKNLEIMVENEDRTQYAVEYMHQLAYSIYMKQGQTRRPDSGKILPQKHWLRLWEHTDLFSNAG